MLSYVMEVVLLPCQHPVDKGVLQTLQTQSESFDKCNAFIKSMFSLHGVVTSVVECKKITPLVLNIYVNV